jgi:hypothetical protein
VLRHVVELPRRGLTEQQLVLVLVLVLMLVLGAAPVPASRRRRHGGARASTQFT